MSGAVHWKNPIKPHILSRSIQVDEVGVAVLTEVVLCRDETMAAEALDIKADDCPLGLARPYVKSTSADRIEAGMWQATRVFSALLDEQSIGDLKLYKCTTVANREPIQTHPRFKFFAGTFAAPVNGAMFENENFVRFKPYIKAGDPITKDNQALTAPADAKNRKCGVTDYLSPIVHLEETKLVLAEDLARLVEGELGFIEEKTPDTDLKPFWPKRTWLLTKCDPQWVAEGTYKLVREWALSGPRGWDADVYPR